MVNLLSRAHIVVTKPFAMCARFYSIRIVQTEPCSLITNVDMSFRHQTRNILYEKRDRKVTAVTKEISVEYSTRETVLSTQI